MMNISIHTVSFQLVDERVVWLLTTLYHGVPTTLVTSLGKELE
jgi:hypothetical protein